MQQNAGDPGRTQQMLNQMGANRWELVWVYSGHTW
jgi:hypothetical protein